MAQRRQHAKRAGIAEKRIQPPPALENRGTQPIQCSKILEIERHERCAAAAFADFVVQFLQAADRARDGNHMCALRGQRERGGAPDTARGPGHQCDTVFKRLGHEHPSGAFRQLNSILP